MASYEYLHKTDVLVLGAGMAAFFAAIKAADEGLDVLVVSEGASGFNGQSVGGTHRLRAVLDEDDFDAAFEGTVKESEYMIDQEFAETALAETWERIQDLQKMGVKFRMGDDGGIRWDFADTLDPNFKQRNVCWEPMGSYKHLLKVKKAAVNKGVTVIDRIVISGLLTDDSAVCGAVGFGAREGEFHVFSAHAVVVATGTFSGGAVNNPSLSGDGIAMAVKVGAELRNMEFGRAETGGMPPKAAGSPWIARLLNPQEQEITLVNAKGEEFMEQYELGRRLPGRKPYGPPWRVQLMAMFKEIREGRGPCYVNYSAPDKNGRMREFWGSFYDRMTFQVGLSGIPFNDSIYELGLSRGFSMGGGIMINPKSETNVKGLYAAGAASDMCGSVQYSILSGIMTSMITGRRAGDSAAAYAKDVGEPKLSEEQIEALKAETFKPLSIKNGQTADDIRAKTAAAWLNIDLREERRLKKGILDMCALQEEAAATMMASDLHELAKANKFKNYLLCSEAVGVAALNRKETRLEHIRQDYMLTDNTNWLKWVIIYNDNGRLNTYLQDIPVEKMKYRPEPGLVDRLQLRKDG